jgi:hypothetical protein
VTDCVIRTPHLCVKVKASESTVPIVLGILGAHFPSLQYLAIWLVSPSYRPHFGPQIELQQTFDHWAIAPRLAAQFIRVKVVLEDCKIDPNELFAFCRLFRVHDLPGVMEVNHVARERVASELVGFV